MSKFSCLYFLLLVTVFASANQTEILQPGITISDIPRYETPLFCSINYHKNSLSPISDPKSQSFVSRFNTEPIIPSALKVFPNPAKNQVTVFFPIQHFPGRVNMSLLNLMGQEVRHAVLYSSSATINLSGLTPGIYVYRIWDQDQVFKSGKLIIE